MDLSTIVFYVLIASSTILCLIYWLFFSRLAFGKIKKIDKKPDSVSVIICARNEFDNIENNLPLILEQDYPNFEVIVVDDCSCDGTSDLLKDFLLKYEKLRVLPIKENVNFFSNKKFALALGIKAAKHDIVLLTDADCKPKSKNWITEMQQNFTDKKSIVLGYGGYERKSGLLNTIIRFDAFHIGVQYLSLAKSGLPYMGVGRNLAYKKDVFFNNNGFSKHYQISSGDDDLFINTVANRKNTTISISKEAQILSKPKKRFIDWARQKKRHFSTAKYYKFKHKLILFLYYLASVLFYASTAWLFTNLYELPIISSIVGFKLLSQLIIFKLCMLKLDEKNFFLISPLLEIILILLNPIIYITNIFYTKNKWK